MLTSKVFIRPKLPPKVASVNPPLTNDTFKTGCFKAGLHWQLWEATLVGDAIFGSESCSATQLLEIEKFLIWVALLSNSTAQKSCWHNKNLGSQQFSMNFISFYCYYFVLFHYFVSISFHFIIFVLFLCDSHKSKFKT